MYYVNAQGVDERMINIHYDDDDDDDDDDDCLCTDGKHFPTDVITVMS